MDNDHRHFPYLARYNRSANEAMIAHLASLKAGETKAPRGSYFVSIQGILDHIIMCDINWLRRFRELYPNEESLKRPRLSPSGHAWLDLSYSDFEEYRRDRAIVDAIFIDWIASADTARLGEVLAYKDSRGDPKRFYGHEALDHVFNHQTHHRGQISQILDELAVKHDYSNLMDSAEIPGA
jgi:uncharacterized damage-inducible protein DinB